MHDSGLAEASDEIHGPAPNLLHDDGDDRALDGLLVDVGEMVLQLLNTLARHADLADERQRGATVGSHENGLVEILVAPDLDLENVLRADDVVLVRLLGRGGLCESGRCDHYGDQQRQQPRGSSHGIQTPSG